MISDGQVLLLSGRDVERLALSMDEVSECVRGVFLAQAQGELCPAPRTVIGSQDEGRFLAFPAVLPTYGLSGVKWLSIGHSSPQGEPLPLSAHILVSDTATGALRAFVDARWITRMRTVAVTVIAAEALADPQSACIGFIGCGQQASAHLASLAKHFSLTTVLGVGRGPSNTARFLAEAKALGLVAKEADIASCLRESDIIISATSAQGTSKKALDEAWLKPGAFVSFVDLGRIWQSQPCGNRLVVDDPYQFAHLLDEGRIPHIGGNPSPLCKWLVTAPKNSVEKQTTLFMPTGFGVADLALASKLISRAAECGLGISLDLA